MTRRNRPAEVALGARALLVLVLSLIPWALVSRRRGWFAPVPAEAVAAFRDMEAQSLVILCLVFDFCILSLLGKRGDALRLPSVHDEGVWLVLALPLATLRYAWNYAASSKSTRALALTDEERGVVEGGVPGGGGGVGGGVLV
jgi:hypothetical protein